MNGNYFIIALSLLVGITANAQFRFKPGGNFYLSPDSQFGIEWTLKCEKKIDIDKGLEFGIRKQGLFIYQNDQFISQVYENYLLNHSLASESSEFDYDDLEVDDLGFDLEVKNISYYLAYKQYLNARMSLSIGLNVNRIKRIGINGHASSATTFNNTPLKDNLELTDIRKTFTSYEITLNRRKWRRIESHYGFRFTPLKSLFIANNEMASINQVNDFLSNKWAFTYGVDFYLFQIKK